MQRLAGSPLSPKVRLSDSDLTFFLYRSFLFLLMKHNNKFFLLKPRSL